jgi:hypothetical protein
MSDNGQPPADGTTRELLAILVSVISLAAVIVFGLVAIFSSHKDQAKDVLTAVLPMIGTWVGTVLAFYFTKQNFEAAARSVQDIAKQVSSRDKLKAVPAQSKMIKIADMFSKQDPIDQEKLVDVLKQLDSVNKGDRIPVLTSAKAVKYIIHRSMIDRYLTDKAAGPAGQGNLTFGDMFKDRTDLQELFARSFATIKPNASLADAQIAMENVADCEDVFVTAQGGRQDEVLGWITDNIIQANLRA